MAKEKRTKPLKYTDKSAGQAELASLFQELRKLISVYAKGNYVVKSDGPGHYELYYGREVEQNGRKYPEICFASLLIQKGYVGFYYFPIYVDETLKNKLKPELMQTLKGKTCFYVKQEDPVLLKQIKDALKTGSDYYSSRGWK